MKFHKPFYWIILLFTSHAYCIEEFIDLGTFLPQRTQQYPLTECNKIYLNTPPRSGSTMVYNLLRFLFERDENKPWGDNFYNLIVKSHGDPFCRNDVIYVCTLRNPIDACLSDYRIACSKEKKLVSLEMLDELVQRQVRGFKNLQKLITNKMRLLILEYDEFVSDFDHLLVIIENKFKISIAAKDKELLKHALSKENVKKNAEKFNSFLEQDEYSLVHGDHIAQYDFSPDLAALLRMEIVTRMSRYEDVFKKWGYSIQ